MEETSHARATHSDSRKNKQKLMGALAYLGVFILIPLFVAKDDPVVKFHIKQGLILVIAEIVLKVLSLLMFGWLLWPFIQIVNLAIFILSIVGIINVLQEKEKELPLVGHLAKNFTF